jgi:hypothetical protein
MMQSIALTVNDVSVSANEWHACDQWSQEVKIPGELVKVGWNRLDLRYAYTAKPVVVTDSHNPDGRPLSVGFTKLQISQR